MTSDSGLTRQDSDDARYIQEVLNELRQMQQTPRLVTSPDELAYSGRMLPLIPVQTCHRFQSKLATDSD
jgi:hypothetical protein